MYCPTWLIHLLRILSLPCLPPIKLLFLMTSCHPKALVTSTPANFCEEQRHGGCQGLKWQWVCAQCLPYVHCEPFWDINPLSNQVMWLFKLLMILEERFLARWTSKLRLGLKYSTSFSKSLILIHPTICCKDDLGCTWSMPFHPPSTKIEVYRKEPYGNCYGHGSNANLSRSVCALCGRQCHSWCFFSFFEIMLGIRQVTIVILRLIEAVIMVAKQMLEFLY